MTEIFERLTQLAEQAIVRLKVGSALNASLWLSAVAIPFGVALAIFSSGHVQVAGLVLAFIPVILLGIAFLYFVFTDPAKLRFTFDRFEHGGVRLKPVLNSFARECSL